MSLCIALVTFYVSWQIWSCCRTDTSISGISWNVSVPFLSEREWERENNLYYTWFQTVKCFKQSNSELFQTVKQWMNCPFLSCAVFFSEWIQRMRKTFHASAHMHTYIHTHMYEFWIQRMRNTFHVSLACVHGCMHVWMCMCVCMYECMYVWISIYIYIYMNTSDQISVGN